VKRRILVGVVLALAAACGTATTAKEVEIKAPTLQCSMCEKTVSDAVKKVDGVSSVSVDMDKKVVRVAFAEGATNVGKIESAISGAGYQANGSKPDKAAYKSLPDCCKMTPASH
jgi:mercuric ion binding protein